MSAIIKKHFRPPARFANLVEREWNRELSRCLRFNSEWLEMMANEFGGNVVAGAVEEMAKRLENETD